MIRSAIASIFATISKDRYDKLAPIPCLQHARIGPVNLDVQE